MVRRSLGFIVAFETGAAPSKEQSAEVGLQVESMAPPSATVYVGLGGEAAPVPHLLSIEITCDGMMTVDQRGCSGRPTNVSQALALHHEEGG